MTLKLIFINVLTLIRIIGTIFLIPIYKSFGGFVVGIVSLFCYFTDCLDGFFARKWRASTFFGAFFDGTADKLLTIINFIVLYLITPYSLIPIVFEVLITLVQFFKYHRNMNIKSNNIGKFKIWVLAICVVLTFFVSDISSISFLSINFKETILAINSSKLYFWLLFPAIMMEALTLLSYLLEMFTPQNIDFLHYIDIKYEEPKLKSKSIWENFKNIWLNPEYYEKHKNDVYLRRLTKLRKKAE